MNVKQFINQFKLSRIDDRSLLNSLSVTKTDPLFVDALSQLMDKIPIELYKHSFDSGTTFYISINTINRKIVSEFYFEEDDQLIFVFDFIKKHLDQNFAVQNIFNDVNFITKYTDECLDSFNDKKITLDQMNQFLLRLTDKNVANIVQYGSSLIECLNKNKTNILNSINSSDDLFGGVL